MNSELVIKVKCNETLRRLTAFVQSNGSLNFDMNGLRLKIFELFSLKNDADVVFNYIDEDGDTVALIDDNDLRDAVKQRLNPLRITVSRKTKKSKKTKISDTSLSSATTAAPRPFPQINEALEYVPEQFRDTVTKLTSDLASKAKSMRSASEQFGDVVSKLSEPKASSSASPVLGDFVESLIKLGLSQLGQVSQFQAGTANDATVKPMKDDKNEKPLAFIVSQPKAVASASKNKTKVADCNNSTKGIGASTQSIPASVDASVNILKDSDWGKSVHFADQADPRYDPLAKFVDVPIKWENPGNGSSTKSVDSGTLFHPCNNAHGNSGWQPWFATPKAAMLPVPPVSTIGSSNDMNAEDNTQNLCNVEGNPLSVPLGPCTRLRGVDDYRRIPAPNQRDSMGRIFHKGVVCDNCGVHPITGPRFKSKVKHDYDLCSICYLEMGNPADYNRMDIPMSYSRRCTNPMKGYRDLHSGFKKPSVTGMRASWAKPQQLSLDSQFIEDVNVVDGTLMGPSTPFVKIWRMHNNGMISWPHGTQLVWIGGEQISDRTSVDIGVPSYGSPVGSQIDVAVDFIAPDRPGRYISYWRMALPSGQKFGQCVWVLIHVESSLENSISGSSQGLNLNMPPQSSGPNEQIIDMNVMPEEEQTLPRVESPPSKDQELDFPTNDSLLVNNSNAVTAPVALEVPVTPDVRANSFYPIIDLTMVPEPSLISSVTTISEAPKLPLGPSGTTVPVEVDSGDTIEEALLKELESMGFKQVDLNIEVLRTNEYNLERSVEELCCMSEWDPILDELKEMGFNDKVTNKKLLVKNAGSIKRVVMDLISGENAQ